MEYPTNSIQCPQCYDDCKENVSQEFKISITNKTVKKLFIYETTSHLENDTSICILQCDRCNKDVAVLHKDLWVPVNEFLHRPDIKDGIAKVETEADRIDLYILTTICHNQYDLDMSKVIETNESPFLPHQPDEMAWIMWLDGAAVGFYTVKNKGAALYGDESDFATYKLPIIDTIYIRKEMRGRGLGSKMIQHFFDMYPGENIGFSAPMSSSLLAVMYKKLYFAVAERDRVWECSFDGSEGYRKNIWFHTKAFMRQQQRKFLMEKQRQEENKQSLYK